MIDKWSFVHLLICFLVSILFGGICLVSMKMAMNDTSPIVAAIAGFIGGVAIGVGKEFGDYVNPYNGWNWMDFLFDVIGSLLGSIVIFLI